MIEYIPIIKENPKMINNISPWGDIPQILKDIIVRFGLKTELALDFGVELGYSTSALAYYFKRVIGIDTFRGDFDNNDPDRKSNYYQVMKSLFWEYPNINLIVSMYQDFIKQDFFDHYDLIHIDLIHSFDMTYDCGKWAVNHSDCVLFHDIISFPEVAEVCTKLADEFGFDFYNYPESYGLGILIKKK